MTLRRLLISLVLLAGAALFSQEPDTAPFVLSSAPGEYRENIILEFSADREFESILYRLDGFTDSQFISSRTPLLLNTPPGSRRRYRIEALLISQGRVASNRYFEYVIDRMPPAVPRPNQVQGVYRKPLDIAFETEDDSSLVFVLSGSGARQEGSIAPGETLSLQGVSGQLVAYQLQLRARDSAGNFSPAENFRYIIDRRNETRVENIPVISPVEGNFANPQLLYIDERGFSQLRYTLDGSDPRLGGIPYAGPVLLSPGEDIPLRVFGITHDGRELYALRRFSAGINEYSRLDQGLVSENIVIPALRADLYYRIDDRPVSRFDNPLDRPLRISLQPGSLRALPLRIFDAVENSEFRYVYLLDGRRPSPPDVQVYSFNKSIGEYLPVNPGDSISRRIRISFRADRDSDTFYRIGELPPQSDPAAAGRLFGNDEIILPADMRNLSISFQSLKNASLWSSESRLDFMVSPETEGNPEPELSIEDGRLLIRSSRAVNLTIEPNPQDFQIREIRGSTEIGLPPGILQDYLLRFSFVNDAGSVSDGVTEITATVDTRLQAGPAITVENRVVTINAEDDETVYYRIIRQGGAASPGSSEFLLYSGPIALQEVQGFNVAYIVETYSESEQTRSALSRTSAIPVHSVTPSAAQVAGVENGSSVQGRELTLFIRNSEPGVRYYYSIGRDGSIPPIPYPDGDFSAGEIRIAADPDTENQQVNLLILPVSSENPELKGVSSRLSFSFDNEAPEAPRIVGLEPGSEYRDAVNLTLQGEGGTEIFYEISREDGGFLISPDSPFTSSFTISGIEGRRILYRLRAYSQDQAGNRSEDVTAAFIIDRELPELPQLSVRTADDQPLPQSPDRRYISNEDLRLRFESEEQIVFELASGTQIPRVPDGGSNLIRESLQLKAEAGSRVRYSLLFRSLDNAGNLGQTSGIYEFIIDREPPDIPPSPRVQRDGNAGLLSWTRGGEDGIEYAVSSAAADPDSLEFSDYDFPIEWQVAESQESLVLYYRSVDEAGNTSPLSSLILPRLLIAPLPKLSGVQDGGVYVQPRTVEVFPGNGGLVRYEISSDGSDPPAVGESSPVWANRLSFQAAQGETVEYRVTMRQYIPGFEPSRELSFSFTIDRSPPSPPGLRGIEEKLYSPQDVIVDFVTEEDGQAVYQISEYLYPRGELPLGWDRQFAAPAGLEIGELASFAGPVTLQGYPNEMVLYNIRAYAFDAAGNRSAQDRIWNIIVDRRNVFVDPAAASSGNGGRDLPFADLIEALDFAAASGRSEIYLAEGSYPIIRPINIGFTTGLYGSFRSGSWEPGGEPSFIFAEKSFSERELIRSRRNRLVLDSLYLSDSARNLDQIILAENADLSISNSLLTVNGGSSAIQLVESSLRLQRSEVNGYELDEATLIKALDNSDLRISDSKISAEDLPDFLESDLHGSYILISSQDSTVQLRASEVVPASGDSTIGVYLFNSSFFAEDQSLFTSGTGRSASSAFFADQSDMLLQQVRVEGSSEAGVVSLIAARESDIALQDSDVVLTAAFGVNGISITSGSLLATGSRFFGTGGRDFVNSIVARSGAELEIRDSSFEGAETAEYIFALVEDSEVFIADSQFSLTGRESYAVALSLGENSAGRLVNNRLGGSIYGTAILAQTEIGNISMEVENNTFEGWGLILQEIRDSFRSSQQRAGQYQTLQQLENLQGAGLIFTGNAINQGL